MAPAVAILSNPFGGWLAARIGRVKPLLTTTTKLIFLVGALLTAVGSNFETVFAGRTLVGIAYGIDFAVAMALLAEYTPKTLKGRLNFWQSVWYIATTTNLLLTLTFFKLGRVSLALVGRLGGGVRRCVVRPTTAVPRGEPYLARFQGKLEKAATNLERLYGFVVVAGPLAAADQAEARHQVGFKDARVLFRGVYLPRTLLSTAISLTQAMQYFAVGWYLPVISLALFGNQFEKATLGSVAFNAVGIVGGGLSAYFGRRLGLRGSSMGGYAVVFLALLVMGATFGSLPIAVGFFLPVIFIFFHSAGPGANGKSIAALSYRSDIRTLGTGVTGMLGSFGSVAGLYVFPQMQAALGVGTSLMILSLVPLVGLLVCAAIKWDPTRTDVNLEEERIHFDSRQTVSA